MLNVNKTYGYKDKYHTVARKVRIHMTYLQEIVNQNLNILMKTKLDINLKRKLD